MKTAEHAADERVGECRDSSDTMRQRESSSNDEAAIKQQ
jgi:hypothetical protein